MATREEIYDALRNADKVGDTQSVRKLAEYLKTLPNEAASAPEQAELPSARKPPPTLEVVTSAPYKSVAGAADMFLTAPQNVINLAKMGFGTAATAAGYPELAPEVTAPRQPVAETFRRMGLIKPTENMTTGQRLLDVGLQAATGGAISPASSLRELGGSAIKGGLAGLAGHKSIAVTQKYIDVNPDLMRNAVELI